MSGPGRAPNERDTVFGLNGTPAYLGAIVSAGTAMTNANCPTPFNATVPLAGQGMGATLAGRTLLIQSTVSGFVLGSATATNPIPLVATQTTIPPAVGTAPGVLLSANVPAIIIMRQDRGWLQYIPTGAAAGTLMVWELE